MKILLIFLVVISYVNGIETRQEAIDQLPFSSYPTASAWKRLGIKDHRGIRLPHLTSLKILKNSNVIIKRIESNTSLY